MIRYAWIVLLGLSLMACSKNKAIYRLSSCLSRQIGLLQSQTGHCKDPFIEEYRFQNQTVYVLRHGTCGADMTDEVIDANCKHLGYLGGFVGNTKINGEDFRTATLMRVIWKAP